MKKPGTNHDTGIAPSVWAARAFSWILGVPFCLWMLLWGMEISALVGAVLLVPFRRRWIGFALLPLFIWNVSLGEFSDGMRQKAAAEELGPRDRAAVSGFNIYMAVLGFPLFPEVARETIWLTRGETDTSGLSRAQRLARCSASVSEPVIRRNSDFILRDDMALAAAERAWATGEPQRLTWANYEQADSVRVALALWTPDAMVSREGDQLVASATIRYPASGAFYVQVPTLFGPVPVGLDEGIFCHMQAQGHWNPYRVEWVFDGPP
ncbi:MAG TPA: hypothetical protein QGF58_09175 [Myxococcota bacterium]|nr:hypothetical protein [Myxococcota bacterium]